MDYCSATGALVDIADYLLLFEGQVELLKAKDQLVDVLEVLDRIDNRIILIPCDVHCLELLLLLMGSVWGRDEQFFYDLLDYSAGSFPCICSDLLLKGEKPKSHYILGRRV